MDRAQSARLDRKKLFGDPIMVSTIVVLLIFLALFILYPLAVLLVESVSRDGRITLDVFRDVLDMGRFRTAFTNTLQLGFITSVGSTLLGLLFAYVDCYVNVRTKALKKLFDVVSTLPVVSPPFVLSLSMILLFGRAGLITNYWNGNYS